MTAISTAPPSVLPLHLRTLAVDIGGTGTKALVLDDQGVAISPREKLPTPRPATPPAVLDVIADLASRQPHFDRVAVGFPGVVKQGVTFTAPNLHPDWAGFHLERELAARLGKPVRAANDADVQGFGAIHGEGLEMVLTLGTGLGSAQFIDGILVPNLELAHHPFSENRTYEQWLGQKSLDAIGEERWKAKLFEAVDLIRRIFNFNMLYLGGGNSRRLNQEELPPDVRTVPNIAGLLGGIALWSDMHGTSLVRAPHSTGAYCAIGKSSSVVVSIETAG